MPLMESRTISNMVLTHCAYQISSARITQISLTNVKAPAHVASFSHNTFAEARGLERSLNVIKSVLFDNLGTDLVHHQPASRSLFPEVM